MWQKLVAGACVMTGSVGFGLALCGELTGEIKHLKKQKELLLYIIGEITYLHRPASEIFCITADRISEPYSGFLLSVAEEIENRSGRGLVEIWSENIRRMKADRIPDKAMRYLEKMGACFGCEGDKMQTESLRLFERELDECILALTEKQRESGRLIKTLSALTGLLCIVLFL